MASKNRACSGHGAANGKDESRSRICRFLAPALNHSACIAYLPRQCADSGAGRKSAKSTYSSSKNCLACQDVLASVSEIPVLATCRVWRSDGSEQEFRKAFKIFTVVNKTFEFEEEQKQTKSLFMNSNPIHHCQVPYLLFCVSKRETKVDLFYLLFFFLNTENLSSINLVFYFFRHWHQGSNQL